jgi:hypothetical protein
LTADCDNYYIYPSKKIDALSPEKNSDTGCKVVLFSAETTALFVFVVSALKSTVLHGVKWHLFARFTLALKVAQLPTFSCCFSAEC